MANLKCSICNTENHSIYFKTFPTLPDQRIKERTNMSKYIEIRPTAMHPCKICSTAVYDRGYQNIDEPDIILCPHCFCFKATPDQNLFAHNKEAQATYLENKRTHELTHAAKEKLERESRRFAKVMTGMAFCCLSCTIALWSIRPLLALIITAATPIILLITHLISSAVVMLTQKFEIDYKQVNRKE